MVDVPNLAEVAVKVWLDTKEYDISEAALKRKSRSLSDSMSDDMKKWLTDSGFHIRQFSRELKQSQREDVKNQKAALEFMGVDWRLFQKEIQDQERERASQAKAMARELAMVEKSASKEALSVEKANAKARADINAAAAQAEINQILGVERQNANSARASASVFINSFKEIEAESKNALDKINALGVALEKASKLRSEAFAARSQEEFNSLLGVTEAPKKGSVAGASATAFDELFAKEDENARRFAQSQADATREVRSLGQALQTAVTQQEALNNSASSLMSRYDKSAAIARDLSDEIALINTLKKRGIITDEAAQRYQEGAVSRANELRDRLGGIEEAKRRASAQDKENEASLRRLVNVYDTMHAAELREQDAIREINRLKTAGLISDERALQLSREATNHLNRYRQSQESGSGLKQHQLTNLSFQANDVISGLLMGQNPGQIAAQQGGQVIQILQQSEGGIMGGLGSLGKMAGSALTNPYVLLAAAVGSVATAFVSLTARASDSEAVMRKFDGLATVFGSGGAYDPAQILESARALDVYGGKWKDIQSELQTFMSKGISSSALEDFGKTAEHVAKVTGVDVKQAADAMANGFTGGWEQVKALDQQMNFLTVTQLKHIKALFDSGKAQEAQNEAFRIFSEKYGRAYNDSLSEADKLTHALAGSWDNLVSVLSDVTGVEKATKSIGGLIENLSNWLSQYANVKALTDSQRTSEIERVGKEASQKSANVKENQDRLNAFKASHPKPTPMEQGTINTLQRNVDVAKEDYGKTYQRFKDLMIAGSNPIARDADGKPANITTNEAEQKRAYFESLKDNKKPKKERESKAERATNRIMDETRALQEQAQVRAGLDAGIAMGLITREEANRQMEIANTLSKYQHELDTASEKDKPKLEAALASYRKELEAASKSDFATSLIIQNEALSKQNDMLEFEIGLIGKSNNEKRVAIALEQKRRELADKGITDPNDPNYVAAMSEVRRGADLGNVYDIAEYRDKQKKAAEDQQNELAIVKATMHMTRSEAEKYRKEQELINEATRLFGPDAAGMREELAKIAEEWSKTKQEMERVIDIQNIISDATHTLGTAMEDIVINGKSATDVIYGMVKALDAVILKAILLGEGPLAGIFGTKDSGGVLGKIGKWVGGKVGGSSGKSGGSSSGTTDLMSSGLNMLQAVGVLHDGGIGGSPTQFRMDNPANWNNAPKFHAGKIPTSLAPNERRAIILDDEMVLTRKQQENVVSRMGNSTFVFNGVQDYDSYRRNERALKNSIFRMTSRSAGRG